MSGGMPTRRAVLSAPALAVAGVGGRAGTPVSLIPGKLSRAQVASCEALARLRAEVLKSGVRTDPGGAAQEIGAALQRRGGIADAVQAGSSDGQEAALLALVLGAAGVRASWDQAFATTHGIAVPPFTVQAIRFPGAVSGSTRSVSVAGRGRVVLLTVSDGEDGKAGIHDCAQVVVLRVVDALTAKDTKERAAKLAAAVRAAGRLEAALSPALAGLSAAQRHFKSDAARQTWLPDHLLGVYGQGGCKVEVETE